MSLLDALLLDPYPFNVWFVYGIRAVNFGTQSQPECFVIATAGAHPDLETQGKYVVDCVIEDCVIEQPSEHNTHETTCLNLGSSESPADGVMAYHRACVIRNNYVNCAYKSDGLAHLDIDFHAFSVDSGTMAVAEGNRVFHCRTGGAYHDTWRTRDLVIRNNYYHNVVNGPVQHMGGFSGPRPGASGWSLTHVGKTATFETGFSPANGYPQGHGLSVGDGVRVAFAEVGGSQNNPYNGFFVVTAVTATAFSYEMLSDPGANALGAPQFGALWQTNNLVIENNVIELATLTAAGTAPIAMDFDGLKLKSPYVFRKVTIRNNWIRQVDDQSDPNSYGILMNSVESALIEGNIIDLVGDTKILFSACGVVKGFNNSTSAGANIPVKERSAQPPIQIIRVDDGVAGDIEAAVLLAL